MPTSRIARAFEEARDAQARLHHGRPLTEFDRRIGEVVLRASLLAMDDVARDRRSQAFKIVSAPTGGGKSCSAAAVAAALLKADPEFSAAFVVDTIRNCDEVYRLVIELTGPEDVAVWSSAHDFRADDEATFREHGFRPAAKFHPDELRTARVVIVTHRKWLGEMAKGTDVGVRRCRGQRRSVVFVDEHPELVKLIERTPGDITKLRDAVYRHEPDHPWVPILNRIFHRMNTAFMSTGATYVAVELVTPEEAAVFSTVTAYELERFTAVTSMEERRETAETMRVTARFITAAGRGCVFLSRQEPRSFVAYELEFDPGPGHVLLDATADLTGMAVLLPGMEEVDVPQVHYGNLEITHMKAPQEFGRIREVVKSARTARPYAEWIRRAVLENTQPGDQVLVVTHKALFEHEYLEPAEDPEKPLDWAGRRVNTLHWGVGIGSNKYKSCMTVFLFSEFFLPKSQVIGRVLGYRRKRADEADLSGAVAARMTGDYLTVSEGHLLRWAKQLACRGAVRNIDAEGNSGRMRLFTSMDFGRLTANLPRLFPGARSSPAAIWRRWPSG